MSYPNQHYGDSDSNNLQFYASNYETPAPAAAAGRYSRGGIGGANPTFGGSGGVPGASVGGVDGMSAAASGERLSGGWLAAFGTGGYSDEPPLLEELGINFGHIKSKTLTVLNPLARVDQNIMDDSDLAGPILFCLLLALLGSISLHLIMNLMATTSSIDFIRTASVLGYCLLPLVCASAFGVVMSMDNVIGYFISTLAIFWCTYSSSAMFVAVLQLSDMRPLVAYPLMLFYSVFAVMSIFADKA